VINIQEISDKTLFRVINEGHNMEWDFFALKVMILRLRLKLSMSENYDETMQQCYTDLRVLLHKSSNVPSAKKDLQTIVENFMEK